MATYGGENDQAKMSPIEVKRKPRIDPNKTGVASIVKRLSKASINWESKSKEDKMNSTIDRGRRKHRPTKDQVEDKKRKHWEDTQRTTEYNKDNPDRPLSTRNSKRELKQLKNKYRDTKGDTMQLMLKLLKSVNQQGVNIKHPEADKIAPKGKSKVTVHKTGVASIVKRLMKEASDAKSNADRLNEESKKWKEEEDAEYKSMRSSIPKKHASDRDVRDIVQASPRGASHIYTSPKNKKSSAAIKRLGDDSKKQGTSDSEVRRLKSQIRDNTRVEQGIKTMNRLKETYGNTIQNMLELTKTVNQQGVNINHPEADKYASSATKTKGKVKVHRPDEVKPTQKPKIVDDGKVEDLYGTGTQFSKGDDSDEDFQLGVGRESVAHGKQSTPPRATNLVARLKKGGIVTRPAGGEQQRIGGTQPRDRIKVNIRRGKSWKVSSGDPDYEKKKFEDDPDRKPKTVGFSNTTSYDELQSKPPRRPDVMGFKKMLLDILLKAKYKDDPEGWAKGKKLSQHLLSAADMTAREMKTKDDNNAKTTPSKPKKDKEQGQQMRMELMLRTLVKGHLDRGGKDYITSEGDETGTKPNTRMVGQGARMSDAAKWQSNPKNKGKSYKDFIADHPQHSSEAILSGKTPKPKADASFTAKKKVRTIISANAKASSEKSALHPNLAYKMLKARRYSLPINRIYPAFAVGSPRSAGDGKGVDPSGKQDRKRKQTYGDNNTSAESIPSKPVKDREQGKQLDMFKARTKDQQAKGLEATLRASGKETAKDWEKSPVTDGNHKNKPTLSTADRTRLDRKAVQKAVWEAFGMDVEKARTKDQQAKGLKATVGDFDSRMEESYSDHHKEVKTSSVTNAAHKTRDREIARYNQGGQSKKQRKLDIVRRKNQLNKARQQGDGKGVDPTGKDPWAEEKEKRRGKKNYQDNLQILANLNTDLAKGIKESYIVDGVALNKEEWNLHRIQEARLSATRTHIAHRIMQINCDCPVTEIKKNHAFPLTTAEKPGMVMRGEPSAMYSADGKALEEDPMARKIDIRDKKDSKLEANTRTVETTQDSKGRITVAMKSLLKAKDESGVDDEHDFKQKVGRVSGRVYRNRGTIGGGSRRPATDFNTNSKGDGRDASFFGASDSAHGKSKRGKRGGLTASKNSQREANMAAFISKPQTKADTMASLKNTYGYTIQNEAEPTICSSLAVFNSILNKTEYDEKVVARQGAAKKSKRRSISNSTTDTAGQQTNHTRGI